MMDPSNPFGEMMQQAVKMKGASQATLKTKFDGWPKFYQNSMFAKDDLLAARKADFEKKMEYAQGVKAEGTKFFSHRNYFDAELQYEKCLSVFKYLLNTNEKWRNQGIKDEDLKEMDTNGETREQLEQITQIKLSCYLNIAMCELKLKGFPVAIQACNEALRLDESNAKALYRRAQALIIPASSGGTEQDLAIKDLMKAVESAPEDKTIRKELTRLRKLRTKQKQLDRKTFSGTFDRGQVYDPKLIEQEKKKGEEKKKKEDEAASRKQLLDVQNLIRKYELEGKTKEAQELRDGVEKALSKAADKSKKEELDFHNPTPQMIKDAKEKGIDLTDPRVVEMLTQLQKDPDGTDLEEEPSGIRKAYADGDLSDADSTELIANMSRYDLQGFLHQEKVALDEDATDEELREVAKIILDSNHSGKKKNNVWPFVVCVSIPFLIYRLTSLGFVTSFLGIEM